VKTGQIGQGQRRREKGVKKLFHFLRPALRPAARGRGKLEKISKKRRIFSVRIGGSAYASREETSAILIRCEPLITGRDFGLGKEDVKESRTRATSPVFPERRGRKGTDMGEIQDVKNVFVEGSKGSGVNFKTTFSVKGPNRRESAHRIVIKSKQKKKTCFPHLAWDTAHQGNYLQWGGWCFEKSILYFGETREESQKEEFLKKKKKSCLGRKNRWR